MQRNANMSGNIPIRLRDWRCRFSTSFVELHNLGGRKGLCCAARAIPSRHRLDGRAKGTSQDGFEDYYGRPALPFDFRDKSIIGSYCRYHRKALPKEQHTYFRDLDTKDRDIVRKLAGILRVADGLDRTHQSKVKDISCRVDKKQVKMVCRSAEPLDAEFDAARDKGVLFEDVFARKLVFERGAC